MKNMKLVILTSVTILYFSILAVLKVLTHGRVYEPLYSYFSLDFWEIYLAGIILLGWWIREGIKYFKEN